MWQNVIVIAVVAMAAGVTAWMLYGKLTGRSSCCGGGSSCSGSCSSQCGGQGGSQLKPLAGHGSGCGCSR